MSYKALYREWRPRVFDDVVEQEHVVKTLKHSVETGHIAHAYLFCGTRGTGKTSMAQILSRAVNCLEPQNGNPCNKCEICTGILSGTILDVIEIDAASNNSVENVRDIRDDVMYSPSKAKYKVYIIDEVHMLSTGAFNALLKTLEEPPAHVIFILATTEPHKLPVTILSRCQKFEFRRISTDSIIKRLELIADTAGVKLHRDASRLIASMADGALRDAITLLDQCISLGGSEISGDDVLSVAGRTNDSFIAEIAEALKSADVQKLLSAVDDLVMDGKDIPRFVSDLVLYFRNLLICKVSSSPEDIVHVPEQGLELMKKQARDMSREEIIYIIRELSALEASIKWSAQPRVLLEVELIRICDGSLKPGSHGIEDRLSALERKVNSICREDTAPRKTKASPEPADAVPAAKAAKTPSARIEKTAQSPALKAFDLKVWNGILSELKSMGRMTIYSNLTGAKPIELDSGSIGIVFPENGHFNKMFISTAENIGVLQDVISKKLGRKVIVRCLDEEDSPVTGDRTDPISSEVFEKARNFAEKFDVPFNIIDE